MILASDGPAPLAKLLLQRKRRLDMIKLVDQDQINVTENLSLNLSPGTDFMLNLEKHLTGFIQYVKTKYNVEVFTLINDSDEGEIKIRHELQKIQNKNATDTHIVYSGDSDVILLLFTCNNLKYVYQALNKDMIISFGKFYDVHVEKFGSTEFTKYDFVLINLWLE